MFAASQNKHHCDKAIVITTADDMTSVVTTSNSTCSMSWGKATNNDNDNNNDDDDGTSNSSSICCYRGKRSSSSNGSRKGKCKGRGSVICAACTIIVAGFLVGSLVAWIGFRSEKNSRNDDFDRSAYITVTMIQDSFQEYVDAASMIHGRCRHRPPFNTAASSLSSLSESSESSTTALFLEMMEPNSSATNTSTTTSTSTTTNTNRNTNTNTNTTTAITSTDDYYDNYMTWSKDFREDFRELYEYINATGLQFKAIQFDPNITWQERPIAEAEANAYYSQNYPETSVAMNYTGFRGFNQNDDDDGDDYSTTVTTTTKPEPSRGRTNQSFYFPVHYMLPVRGNEAWIDLDYYSSESTKRTVEALFQTEAPSLTDRLSFFSGTDSMVSRCNSGNGNDELFSAGDNDGPSFGVVLMHPGIQLSRDDETNWPKDISSIVICLSDLIARSTEHMNMIGLNDHLTDPNDHETRMNQLISVYIHDLSHPTTTTTNNNGGDPVFMVAARLQNDNTTTGENDGGGGGGLFSMTFLDEIPLHEFDYCTNAKESSSCYQRTLDIANRKWTVTIIDEQLPNYYRLGAILILGVIVFLGFVSLARWVMVSDRKNRTASAQKAQAAAERNTLVLDNANRAAQTERELIDFLAHEVRNPLSAAMAATQFLRTELEEDRHVSSNSNSNSSSSSKGESSQHQQRGIHVHFEDSSHESDNDNDNNIDNDNDELDNAGINETAAAAVDRNSSPRLIQAREDVQVVDHALRFINDLLRNMLDMHRASSGKMQVKFAPVDLLHDVLAPVAGMLHRGGEGRIGRKGKGDEKVNIIVECPENIVVEADVLRLKQVVLNLGRNSVKFINEGFIRLRVEVVEVDDNDNDDDDDHDHDHHQNSEPVPFDIESGKNSRKTVQIYVEDSGSGIPMEKRELLFAKYQESLDLLSQGTGIGLHLCQNLVELMGGEISLDNEYDSGVPNCPGAKFVVDLRSAPLDTSVNFGDENFEDDSGGGGGGAPEGTTLQTQETEVGGDNELPKTLSVLFVDDDRVLRKLFARTIKTVAPEWTIQEAANGETAILLAEEEEFDLIFCDMYMASVEKQLLGTETVAELRSKGVKSRICGLSANDKELEFLEAGCDAFLFKPIPCQAKILRGILHNILYGEKQ